jgi:hypothetical protein
LAIYHCSTKPISRSSGRSATASIAYRAGVAIEDQRQGKTFDYSKRYGVLHAELLTPNNINISRSELWNLAETTETRKNSRTAREFVVNIPHELMTNSHDAGIALVREFSQHLKNDYGVAVDFAIHAPDQQGDNRNYHAHILLTTRKLERLESGRIALTGKSDLEQSNTQLKAQGKRSNQDELKHIRERWATITNHHLEQSGINTRIDHRSHKDRGLEELPTVKMGWQATELERKGIQTDVGDQNRLIKQYNLTLQIKYSLESLERTQIAKEQHEAAAKAEKQVEQPTSPKPHLEHKTEPLEQQPQPPKATATDAKNAIAKYRTAIEETANQLFKEQHVQQIEDAKTWLAKIEDMRAKTPLFLGKKEHLAKIEQEVIQYENMRSNFAKFKELGVTDEHRATAIAMIERSKPIMAKNARNSEKFLTEQQLNQAKEQIDPNISMLAKANQTYYGKVLQSGAQGTVQNTKDGLVYHPQIQDLKTGKEYTLTYTENQIKILENIEINRKSGKSQDNEIKR